MSAEYIMAEGNENVILCERGIRTFETYTRNTLDLARCPHAPQDDPPARHRGPQPRLPAMPGWCRQLAMAAVAAGADGLMIEVHNDPATGQVRWCPEPDPRPVR